MPLERCWKEQRGYWAGRSGVSLAGQASLPADAVPAPWSAWHLERSANSHRGEPGAVGPNGGTGKPNRRPGDMVPSGPKVATPTLHDAEGLYEGALKLGFPALPRCSPRRRRVDLLAWPKAAKIAMAADRHRGKAGVRAVATRR
jgi:hypothetical protein